jgi:hypothetical protein
VIKYFKRKYKQKITAHHKNQPFSVIIIFEKKKGFIRNLMMLSRHHQAPFDYIFQFLFHSLYDAELNRPKKEQSKL